MSKLEPEILETELAHLDKVNLDRVAAVIASAAKELFREDMFQASPELMRLWK